MKSFYTIVLIATAFIANAQSAALLIDNEGWSDGSIMTSEGSELKGLAKYNDKTGILSYHDGENSRAFSPRSAAGFEFYDEALQKQRIFYSLEYREEQEGANKQFFFELLRDYKDFAVLCKIDRIEIDQKSMGSLAPSAVGVSTGIPTQSTWVEVSQKETIFLMKNDGTIEPYLKFVNIQTDESDLFQKDVKKKGKVVDEDVLIRYIGESHFKQLQHFARENKLKFKKKEDFLKILQHYDELRKN